MTGTFVSYAQNFEDVILHRALRDVEKGFYVDIGAQDPVVDSVSLGFYERGWRGVHVDASPHYAAALRVARPDETVIEAAIGTSAEPIHFWEVPETGLSTGDSEIALRHKAKGYVINEIEVASLTLDQVLDNLEATEIHWLKIDVEGMEKEVVQSWTNAVRPWILVIEATMPNEQTPSHEEWEPLVIARGYEFVYFDGLSRFYLHETHSERARHFGPGPNVFDDFVFSDLSRAAPLKRFIGAREEITELARRVAAADAALSKQDAASNALRAELLERDEARRLAEHSLEQCRAELLERDEARRLAEHSLEQMLNTKSWRITQPLGLGNGVLRRVQVLLAHARVGLVAWSTLKLGSRPHRMAQKSAVELATRVQKKPRLMHAVRKLVAASPHLRALKSRLLPPADHVMRTEASECGEAVSLAARRLSVAHHALRTAAPRPFSEDRPRLAFVSPLPPDRSGVGDYTASLLPALAEYYAIDAVVQYDASRIAPIPGVEAIITQDDFRRASIRYDRIIYNIGNSPFHQDIMEYLKDIPGIVVLHDAFIGNLLHHLESHRDWDHYWCQSLYEEGGYDALVFRFNAEDLNEVFRKFTGSFFLARRAQGVLTTNSYARALLGSKWGAADNIAMRDVRLPRSIPRRGRKEQARDQLGISQDAFVICSFGHLGPTKLNRELLEAFGRGSLGDAAKLFFVGGGSDEYSALLTEDARNAANVTGFVEPNIYTAYLEAADIAVQLRGSSRGESSGTVLDAMAFGLPTIINACGSMGELPDDAVIKLPEHVTTDDIENALVRLRNDQALRYRVGESALDLVYREHDPRVVALAYRDAIEDLVSRAQPDHDPIALRHAASQLRDAEGAGFEAVARQMVAGRSLPRNQKQLLVDVSVIAADDYRTGIQRVVRAQLLELFKNPPPGYRVEPVRLSRINGEIKLIYARKFALNLLDLSADILAEEVAEPSEGDIYFIADFFTTGVIDASATGLFDELRAKSVRIYATVYDILPILRPDFFPEQSSAAHKQWLGALARHVDGLICISRTVAENTRAWLESNGMDRQITVDAVHLGADLDASAPTRGLPANAAQVLTELSARPTFLMVGTIEPRKGYLQALRAFGKLWKERCDVNLVIVGAEGWKGESHRERKTIPEIVETMATNPELGRRLFLLAGISDEYLEAVYARATCLLAASEDEGFGLPLIEAARHDLPILARDIPVYREVAGEHAAYFSGSGPTELAASVAAWLTLHARNEHLPSSGMPWLTWHENVAEIKRLFRLKEGVETPRNQGGRK